MLGRLLSLCTIALAIPAALPGQSPDYPEVRRFASNIEGTIWDLRGTFGLKHLRYDGTNVQELRSGDRPAGTYEHAFVDVNVLRLNFKGRNTAWYFFSDDLKYVTPTTVAGEVEFKLAANSTAKPVARFPQDIEGQVWESAPDERQLNLVKLRWTGSQFEIGTKDGETWKLDKVTPTVANRRVFEVPGPDGAPIWFAFSADGKEAWLLQMENIFGGHPRSNPGQAFVTAAQSKLKPQLNDLLNHAEDLVKAGETMRADTLRRHLLRNAKEPPDAAAVIKQRLGGK